MTISINLPQSQLFFSQQNKQLNLNNKTTEIQTNETYVDPLTKWPIRGLAYSNELGAAIMEIAPKLGSLLWVPALMYFGADIYDKYKTQETDYNPSTKRALERTTFQALASVILPTASVHIGQNAISNADKFSKQKLSTNVKENTLEFILDFINKSKISKFDNNLSLYAQKFNNSFTNYLDDVKGRENSKSILMRFFNFFSFANNEKEFKNANTEKLLEYANNEMKKIIDIRTKLMKNERPTDLSSKNYAKFEAIKPAFIKEYGEEHYLQKAAKFTIRKHINSGIFKHKLFKTLGGFIALGFMIKPIDSFVDEVIMKKVVEPNINKLNQVNFKSLNFNKTN